ncbi:uncharacterized protein [Triticum aestivum]|uniref:uncharacterized protein isoform X2 n=1 Tax=Triticum aestivum TaxID=4565 RepID=UPI001D016765|nr:uncharacterized protein LOC123091494 isoform X2 [Triticum aestivum]
MQLHLHPHACSRGGSRCRRRLTWQEQRARCCSNVAVKCCFALVVPTQPSLEACTSVAILFTTDSNAGCRDGWLRPALVSLRPPDEGERHQQEKHDILFLYAYKVFCVHFHGSNNVHGLRQTDTCFMNAFITCL